MSPEGKSLMSVTHLFARLFGRLSPKAGFTTLVVCALLVAGLHAPASASAAALSTASPSLLGGTGSTSDSTSTLGQALFRWPVSLRRWRGGGSTTDTTVPTVGVSSPGSNQSFPVGTVRFAGSAADGVGVASVKVSIQRRDDGLWYRSDGTWGSQAWHTASLGSTNSMSTSWWHDWTSTAAGAYTLVAQAVDTSGNTSTIKSVAFNATSGSTSPVQYGVGTMTIDLVDVSRGRSLPTTVYYPAQPGTSGSGAPAAMGRSFPLVVVGHGAQGTGGSAAQLHQFLVKSGYVIAAPTFPSGFQFTSMARDVSFVITEILARSGSSLAPLAGLVDAEHIGYIGTSMGGMVGLTLYQTAVRDLRIDAVVVKAGSAPSGTYSWAGGPALLMMHGDADTTVSYASGRAAFDQASRPKAFIRLAGVGHDLNVGSSKILQDAPLGFFGYFLQGQVDGLTRVQTSVANTSIASLDAQW